MATKAAKKSSNVSRVSRKPLKKAEPLSNYSFNFDEDSFTISEDGDEVIEAQISPVEGCCGILEIHSLSGPYRDSKKLDDYMQKCLTSMMNQVTKDVSCKTIMVNTNGVESSKFWERALAKSDHFVMVKEFTNSGTRSRIKIWLSNN